MNTEIKPSEVVFFLGAGASIAANVPDTYSFVEEFIKSIRATEKKKTIQKIAQILKTWKGTEIDIELLLETLTKLDNKEQEPLLQFYTDGKFILEGYSKKKPLINDLKDFIKNKAIVSEDGVKYLQPFLGFIEEFRPLNIISLNYDICIEQFCNINKLIYQDGFDVHWNPKTFTLDYTDIHLLKLHGSVMWYQSNRGGYIKLPVMAKASKIQLITGEMAENLMLYPVQKGDFQDPLLELLVEAKRLLESTSCKFLIVVGYSFRDNHIRRILWDAARKNKELHIILIDPNAHQIYLEKLKYYDERQRIPSSLDGRVLSLPYKFEKIFPHLKNNYLNSLRVGLNTETLQHQSEISGIKADWFSVIKPFVDSEHFEKVEKIIERIEGFDYETHWTLSLELYLKKIIHLSSTNQEENASEYLKKFNDLLYTFVIDRINVEILVEKDSLFVRINFNYIGDESSSSYIGANQFKDVIDNLYEICAIRTQSVLHVGNNLNIILNELDLLKQHLEPFQDGRMIKFEDYINYRLTKISNINKIRKKYNLQSDKLADISNESYDNKIKIIHEIETNILKELIKKE